jgi:hypothetical protein
MAKEETVLCTYRVKVADEAVFKELLARHWKTLHSLGLVTDDEALVFRSASDPPTYVEVFSWVEGGFAHVHEHPDVLAIWEAMEPLLEERDGRPRWEFPHYQQVNLST